MNAVLWMLQVLLAVAFAVSGTTKLARSRDALAERAPYVEDFSDRAITLIGVAEVLASVGLIVPGLTGILPVLTPLAALGLVAVMAGAAAVHARRRERHMLPVNAILLVLAAVVAWGRIGPYPL